jgi:hypothetical protein
MKIALYQYTDGTLIGWENVFIVTEHTESRTDMVRCSEITDIDFIQRPKEEILPAVVEGIDRQVEEIKAKAMAEVAKLEIRKSELLALTFEVAA